MRWCCAGFKGNWGEAGQRGFAVIVDRDALGDVEFVLQHRAVDLGVSLPGNVEGPVNLVTDCRFLYCPWCGQELESFYGGSADELIRPGLRVHFPSEDAEPE